MDACRMRPHSYQFDHNPPNPARNPCLAHLPPQAHHKEASFSKTWNLPSPFVWVDCMCQLEWAAGCPDMWINRILNVWLAGCFWVRRAVGWLVSVKQRTSPHVGGPHLISCHWLSCGLEQQPLIFLSFCPCHSTKICSCPLVRGSLLSHKTLNVAPLSQALQELLI